MNLDRRELLKGVLLSAAAGGLLNARSTSGAAAASESSSRPWEVVDTNVSLFQWPFRRLPGDTTEELVAKLRSLGIRQAWAGSFEGLFHRDLRGVNARLAEACGEVGGDLLVPFGSVNPGLPDWEEDLRRCHEELRMPGIRLHPNYHGYALDDPRFGRLLASASERGLLVQLAAAMEDRRTHPLQLQIPDVDLAPLPDLLKQVPGGELMLLNYRPSGALLTRLAQAPRIHFDVARVESTDGIARLMGAASPERVLFGTHAPFLICESALIKVYESELSEGEIGLLLGRNAERITSR